MVAIVIVINVLTALVCFYAAWQVWKLRRTLAKVADTLAAAERSSHKLLHGAPESIIKGQLGIYQLRQAYVRSGPQWQRVRQALLLLGLGRSLWWGQGGRRSSPVVRRGMSSLFKRKNKRL